MSKWIQIEASLMSDEESAEGQFKVHRQEWRSDEFNEWMEELDARASATQGKSRPRITRYYGTPSKVQPPANTPEWMLSATNVNPDGSNVLAAESPDLLH